jgi:hypothetical protein
MIGGYSDGFSADRTGIYRKTGSLATDVTKEAEQLTAQPRSAACR